MESLTEMSIIVRKHWLAFIHCVYIIYVYIIGWYKIIINNDSIYW